VSTGPELIRPIETRERNWLPLAIAAAVLLIVGVLVVVLMEHGKHGPDIAPVTSTADPYAASLPISNVAMSESANLAGGKVTYLDGQIANAGARTVTGVTVQVLFRNAAHEVAQNETHPLTLIRTHDPYIDIQPVAADPIKPGDHREFRLIFDSVTPDWDGAYPQIRILHVQTQ
jgi:hypothetical protein